MRLLTIAVCVALAACAAAKQDEAEAIHTGRLGACVDRYSTREAIDSCRASVEKAWGRYPDGGRILDGDAE